MLALAVQPLSLPVELKFIVLLLAGIAASFGLVRPNDAYLTLRRTGP